MIGIKVPANRSYFQAYDFGVVNFNYPTTIAGDVAGGNQSITNTDTTNLSVGMLVSGDGIPAGSEIISINSPTQFTMNYNAGATFFATPLSFVLPTKQIDEIIVSDGSDIDQNNIVFIKRYNTWLIYSYMKGGNFKYNLLFLSYDRVKQIAYTYTDTLVVLTTS
jgi:hypothetical protein